MQDRTAQKQKAMFVNRRQAGCVGAELSIEQFVQTKM